MIAKYIIPIGLNIFEYIVMIKFVSNFIPKREVKSNAFLSWLLGALFSLCLFRVNIEMNPITNTAFAFFLISIVICILYKGTFLMRVAFSIIFLSLAAATEQVVTFIILIISPLKLNGMTGNHAVYLFAILVSKIILMILSNILIFKFPNKYFAIARKDIVLLSLFPIFGISAMLALVTLISSMQLSLLTNLLLVFIHIGLLSSSVAVFFMYDSALNKRNLENELKISNRINEINKLIFKEQQRSFETERQHIHNFQNQLNNLKSMYSIGRTEALIYHDELIHQFEDEVALKMIDVNNYVISNILERVRRQCLLNEIELRICIEYYQLDFISSTDASMLFDNAFDNAISSSMLLRTNRRIKLDLFQSNYYTMIIISNSKGNEIKSKGSELLSTRRGYCSSGYGLNSIKSVADKYNGDVHFDFSDDEFILTVRLKASAPT